MEIEHWLGAVRRRAVLVTSVLVGALVVGLVLAVVQQPVYKAQAEVVLAQPAGAALLSAGDSTTDLPAELKTARSAIVESAANKTLDGSGDIAVTIDDTSQTLIFEGSGSTAQQAADVANAYASAYVQVRRDRTDAEYDAAITRLRDRVTELNKSIADISGSDSASAAQRDALRSQQASYRSAIDQLEVAATVGGTSSARVLTKAEPPESKSSPVLVNYLIFALLAGLFLAAGAVGVAELLDRSVKDGDAAREALGGAPVIGRVRDRRPATRRRGGTAEETEGADVDAATSPLSGVTLLDAPHSAASEAHRSIRTTVQSMVDVARPFLQVTSVGADDGAAKVAANLAISFANAGLPTVLVCLSDTEQAGVTLPTEPSAARKPLTAFLTGTALTTECLAPVTGVDNLSVITGSPEDQPDDLARNSLGEALKQLQSLPQAVVLLAPPVTTSAVALEAADLVDGSVVVVRERSTPRVGLEESGRALGLMESPLLGVVLT